MLRTTASWPLTAENMRSRMVIFLLFCYACVISGQENVFFTSKNFINILRWNPAGPRFPGEKVRYNVLYSDKDGGEFKRKAGCQNITELFCDLTAETPAVYDVHYRAKVEADDVDYGQTIKFKPVAETVLGAPILSHSINSTSLNIVVYSLTITKPQEAAQTTESRSGHFVVNLKNAQREYCGYVEYKPAVEWGRPLSESTSFCVTQPDHSWLLWSILSVVALSVTVLMAACWAKHYVKPKSKKPLPSSLDIRKQRLSEVIMDPMDDHNICKPEISTNKHNEKHLIYRHLYVLSGKLVLSGYPTEKLGLKTKRNSDGLLTLPKLSLQVKQPFSETTDTLLSLERKPLLSYLTVSSDKGSNFVSLHSLDSSGCSDSGQMKTLCQHQPRTTETVTICQVGQILPTSVQPHKAPCPVTVALTPHLTNPT
ncbi:hypothetical protein WMY93_026689 [Mugilogobius chulae]|uniref:Fibronectin type-III domain-containing protein n=1 Tax=Mugilogobius chulae TaxID=88201 RepID=A0AAW0N8A2_9GOBI